MTDIKIFKCGLCKEKDRIPMTRAGLRKHLREEHRIMKNVANRGVGNKQERQSWWIVEDTEDIVKIKNPEGLGKKTEW